MFLNFLKHNQGLDLSIYLKEDHGETLYNVQIYRPFEIDQSRILFVTVGANRVL